MTNPPARYDAAGTSGIISIKTKKILRAGFNASASVSYSQGRYPKTAEAFNFNYREGKINLFTNLSHNYSERYSTLSIDGNILNSSTGSVDNIFNPVANRVTKGGSYSAKLGVDFLPHQKQQLGLLSISTKEARLPPIQTLPISQTLPKFWKALWLTGTVMILEYHPEPATYFPYSFQIFPFAPALKTQLQQVERTSVGYAVLVLLLGFLDFRKRGMRK